MMQLYHAIFNAGHAKSELLFAQLQGMADEISYGLVKANQSVRSEAGYGNECLLGPLGREELK